MSYEIKTSDSDGYIYSSQLTYDAARDASSGTVVAAVSSLSIGQNFDDPALYGIASGHGMSITTVGKIGQKLIFTGTLTSIKFLLKRRFAGIGTATCTIRNYSSKSLIATIGTVDVSTLSGSYEWIEFPCSPEITFLTPTEIIIMIEYSSGDGSNGLVLGLGEDYDEDQFLVRWYPDIWIDSPLADCAYQVFYRKFNTYRGFLFFDTSGVSGGIIDATLRLYPTGWVGSEEADEFSIVVQSGMPTYPTDPLASADYNRTKYSGNLGSYPITVAGWDPEAEYIDVPLNADGKAAINKGGITKFCLRGDKDVDGDGGYEEGDFPDQYISIWSANFQSGINAARLIITTPSYFAWII